MNLRNIYLGIKDQLPLRRLWKNFRRGGMAIFCHPRTHFRSDGQSKIMYNTQVSAKKAAMAMEKKTGNSFSAWKCWHCDGYHIGKNSGLTKE